MKKNTKKNRERLATEIVDRMDMDTLIEFAQDQQKMFFEEHDDEEFEEVWKQVFGDD